MCRRDSPLLERRGQLLDLGRPTNIPTHDAIDFQALHALVEPAAEHACIHGIDDDVFEPPDLLWAQRSRELAARCARRGTCCFTGIRLRVSRAQAQRREQGGIGE